MIVIFNSEASQGAILDFNTESGFVTQTQPKNIVSTPQPGQPGGQPHGR